MKAFGSHLGPWDPFGHRWRCGFQFLGLKAAAAAELTAAVQSYGDFCPMYNPHVRSGSRSFGVSWVTTIATSNKCALYSAQMCRRENRELAASVLAIKANAYVLYSQASHRRIALCPTNFGINSTSYCLGSAI